ncbi:MAG TPA: methylhydantoinase [Firmicutes bacterium]|nr:methylhydantoinase [Bacillota bacterium]
MSYLVGIDVGGTNTNAVLLKNDVVLATAKAATDHKHLHLGTMQAIASVLKFVPDSVDKPIELHLSTTLATNAVVEGKGAPTAAVIIPGPGLRWEELGLAFKLFPVKGYIDHRGREQAPLDHNQLEEVLAEIKQSGFEAVAVIGKFSPRNLQHELEVEELVTRKFPELLPVTLGHRLSGRLNFPRRITPAVLNASIAKIQKKFVSMVQEVKDRYNLGRIYLLKADGGGIDLKVSITRPIETILSGPAASLMATMALVEEIGDAVVLDIGGTTTEISLFYRGEPLTERDGAEIAGFATLVPALFSRSLGLGGDSAVNYDGHKVSIGPWREGPPVALGGPRVTPTDAVVALGAANIGDQERAIQALKEMGACYEIDPIIMAKKIVTAFSLKAAEAINEIYISLNSRPVYTVSQVMAGENLKPDRLIGMGGPAAYFIPKIAEQMGLPFTVLPYHEAANAIGAAASRPTVATTLRADTALEKLVVPELDYVANIPRPLLFNLEAARREAIAKTITYAEQMGTLFEPSEIEVTEEEVFNMVRGFHMVGKNYTLTTQVKPQVRRIKKHRDEMGEDSE